MAPTLADVTIDRPTYTCVAGLIRDIADTYALPRFGNLAASDIAEKNPGDLVTIADTDTETALSQALEAIVPGSVTVGEEACETDPDRIKVLATGTPAWIIDPIDGTANFATGNPRYSTLVALASGGQVHASWLYAPSLRLSAGAHDGTAWINDTATRLAKRQGSGLSVVTSHPNYADDHHERMSRLERPEITRTPCSSAGLDYLDLIQGRHDAVVFTWEKPWDHACGLHIHSTLGGVNTTLDDSPFQLAGGNNLPFIAGHRFTVALLLGLLS